MWERILSVALVLTVSGTAVLSASEKAAGGVNINNVLCTESGFFGLIDQISGFPLNDHNAYSEVANARPLACRGIVSAGHGFSIGIPGSVFFERGTSQVEGHFLGGGSVGHWACLRIEVAAAIDPKGCGKVLPTDGVLDTYRAGVVVLDFPDSSTPKPFNVRVTVNDIDTPCDQASHIEVCTNQGPAMTIWHYNGGSQELAEITDTGALDTAYQSWNEFREWVIRDPDGDDTISLDGVLFAQASSTTPDGFLVDLLGIQVRYEPHVDGGYQWVVSSTDGSNRALVTDDYAGTWKVLKLNYS